jgi:hypothetical protein
MRESKSKRWAKQQNFTKLSRRVVLRSFFFKWSRCQRDVKKGPFSSKFTFFSRRDRLEPFWYVLNACVLSRSFFDVVHSVFVLPSHSVALYYSRFDSYHCEPFTQFIYTAVLLSYFISHDCAEEGRIMLTFMPLLFLALSALMKMKEVHAAGGGVFAVNPRFVAKDIIINEHKGFITTGCDNDDSRKTGEAFLSPQGIKKIREAVGGLVASSGTTGGGGATVQAMLISKTTPVHCDSHWDSERTPMSADERTGFVVLSSDHDAYFQHGDAMVPLVQGDLVTFEGSIEHNTVVKSGNVLLAGPFDLTTFANVGRRTPGPCSPSLEGKKIGDGSNGTITESTCNGDSNCTICYREEDVKDDADYGWYKPHFSKEQCVEVNGYCSHLYANSTRNQTGFVCNCGLPAGTNCTRNVDCCSGMCGGVDRAIGSGAMCSDDR